MGEVRRERRSRQEEAIESEHVWIQDPKGGGHIHVKKSDLDEKGFLKEEGEKDGDE